jgi:hypothetical protein
VPETRNFPGHRPIPRASGSQFCTFAMAC